MNITYIVGNGFDLGLGLNTRYSDFVEFLSMRIRLRLANAETSWNGDERRFAEWLERKVVENKVEFWHDAEEAFGELPFSYFGEQKRDVVQFCHGLFQSEMAEWIATKNAQFSVPKGSEKEISEKFVDALLYGWTKGLSEDVRTEIENDVTNGSVVINIVSFNYTDCIEKLLWGIDGTINKITEIGNLKRDVHILSPIHVHGKVDTVGRSADLVFGVDDATQITGVETIANDEILSRLIKERYLGYTRKRSEREARDVLSNSNWVIVIGHSFGKTDGRWWKRIFDDISVEQYNIAVCPFYSNMDDVPSYISDPIRYPRMSAERVFQSVKDSVRGKIYEPRFMSHVYALVPIDVEAPDGTSNYCDYLNLAWIGRKCVDLNVKQQDRGRVPSVNVSN